MGHRHFMTLPRPSRALHLVTVAHRKTLPVLEHGQYAIFSLIPAASYTVIVPDEQVDEFRRKLEARFQVLSENQFVSELTPVLGEKISGASESYGWYLQQFIKLAAIKKFSLSGDVLVWDADTVPLRKLHFFSRTGKPLYFTAGEHHREYFEAIRRALGLTRGKNYSFIAQCFPIASHHARAFFERLDQLSPGAWWISLIDSIDFSQKNAFSEYETLGAFISDQFPREFKIQRGLWLRNGWLLFAEPEESVKPFARRLAATGFHYCSFELHQVAPLPLTLGRRIYHFAFMIVVQHVNRLRRSLGEH